MYLCYSIERSNPKPLRANSHKYDFMDQVYVWKVVIQNERPVWRLHKKGYWRKFMSYHDTSDKKCHARAPENVPYMQTAAPGERVTQAQAMKLVGMTLGAAALDFLTENVNDNPELSNYVEPAKPKKTKKAKV